MTDTDIEHREAAIRALADPDHAAAADSYALAAHGELAGHENHRREAFDTDGWAGTGLEALALAAVCDRIAGREDRARQRALQGRAIATEQREFVLDGVDRGGASEFVGDFSVLAGEADAAEAAYDRAAELYEAADLDDPAGATTNPMLQAGTDLLLQLSRPDDVAWDDVHGTGGEALARRVRFRRSRVPEMLDARIDAGRLHPPRGSTEYNSSFRCDACGSTDVNYVANAVLCLRCVDVIELRD
jgi:hypothetical protein